MQICLAPEGTQSFILPKLPNRTGAIKKKVEEGVEKVVEEVRKWLQGGRWLSKGNNLCGSLETRKWHKLSNLFENKSNLNIVLKSN